MDVGRALAAGIVAFSHNRDLLMANFSGGIGQNPVAFGFYFLSGFGHAGVVVFFVLSGFWISKSVVGRSARTYDGGAELNGSKSSERFWPSYMIDRLSRLWIVLVPTLIIGGILDAIGMFGLDAPLYRGQTGAASVNAGVIAALAPSNFLASLAFLQTLVLPPFGSNGPLWSLAFEFWYYVWFPALWLAFRHRRYSVALLTLAIGLLNPELYLGFVSWLCGAALFALVNRIDRNRVAPAKRWIVLGTGALAFAAALVVARMRAALWFDPVLAATFAWLLLGVCLISPRRMFWLSPVARFGAGASFSLYAIHFPIAALTAAFLTGGERFPASPGAMAVVFGVLIATVLLARLFSSLTEANTGKLRVRMRSLIGVSS